jgi:hypothetical protein
MNNRVMLSLAAALIVVFFAASAIHASSSNARGTLHGVVTDPSGAAIPGALVTVSSGGFVHSASTDDTGQYVVRGLAPGHYRLWVHSAGFAAFKKAGLVLSAGYQTEGDAQLAISISTQEITVTDRAPTQRAKKNVEVVHYAGHTSESVSAAK